MLKQKIKEIDELMSESNKLAAEKNDITQKLLKDHTELTDKINLVTTL